MGWAGAARLKAYLKSRRVNQRALARAVNVDPSTLSNYLSGKRSPDPDTLARLCRATGISADELLGLNERGPAAAAVAEPTPDYEPKVPKDAKGVYQLFVRELHRVDQLLDEQKLEALVRRVVDDALARYGLHETAVGEGGATSAAAASAGRRAPSRS